MKLKTCLVFYKDSNLKEHRQALAEIRKILAGYKVKAYFCKRSNFDKGQIKKSNLVLSVGGDGTLLRAASKAKDKLILGINSNSKKSEGALCVVKSADLKVKLKRVIKGDFLVENFAKARVFLKKSGKSYSALNEIYFGSAFSYHTSRYSLKFGKIKEEQKSSGVVISTGLGSTAWYRSIAKESFDPKLKELRFVVRDPYQGKLSQVNLLRGKISGRKKLYLKPNMIKPIVAIDSISEIPLNSKDEVQVSISPEPARLIIFSKGKAS